MLKCLKPRTRKKINPEIKKIDVLEPKLTLKEIMMERITPKYAKKTEFSNIMGK